MTRWPCTTLFAASETPSSVLRLFLPLQPHSPPGLLQMPSSFAQGLCWLLLLTEGFASSPPQAGSFPSFRPASPPSRPGRVSTLTWRTVLVPLDGFFVHLLISASTSRLPVSHGGAGSAGSQACSRARPSGCAPQASAERTNGVEPPPDAPSPLCRPPFHIFGSTSCETDRLWSWGTGGPPRRDLDPSPRGVLNGSASPRLSFPICSTMG